MMDIIDEQEIIEEKAREYANEYDDGVKTVWIADNWQSLAEGFAKENPVSFKDYCNEMFKEQNDY